MNPAIFKAYDIRGVYPEEINEEIAYKIGQAYVSAIKPEGKIAVGMDVRISSPVLKKAVVEGLLDAGIDVMDIGLISTEMLYFAVGSYNLAGGIVVTASHNPAEFNGMKMVKTGAAPISSDNGIFEIRDLVMADSKISAPTKGKVEAKDIMSDFANYMLKYVDKDKIKPTKIVANANFGYEAVVLREVIKAGDLPITIVGLNDVPDGSFPKGRPDPFLPENRPEFVELVESSGADFGAAWDADADRVFFCTGSGKFVDSYFMSAAMIAYILQKSPGETIIYDPRYTWALIDSAKENGGKSLLERVGHSFIKARMRKDNAIFSGESSGHTYFRDFWYADSGIIPLLLVLEMISSKGETLDEILEPYFKRYFISGEFNNKVTDSAATMAKIEASFSDAEILKVDGLSLEYPEWRASIRSSNTEPLLRLNVEAKSEKLMEEKRDLLLQMIQER